MPSTTRDRLVTAANEAMRARGYRGTSVKDVLAAAGAPAGSLYHHFPGGKPELAAAAVRESGAVYGELYEAIADAAPDVAQGFVDFFAGAADVLAAGDYLDVCPIGTIAGEVASSDDDLRAATDDVFRAWTAAAARRLGDAGLPADRAEELATTAIAALQGGFILARARRDADLLTTVGRQVATLVTAALASTGVPR
ncbi:MAG: TetR/AcrR family transcriptional regulator [Acidimicrobiales bacterium]|nr:TetR/AcrR family transcriptional regulator [Acidimicrobiales bacterium]